jgi:hypothetical protein
MIVDIGDSGSFLFDKTGKVVSMLVGAVQGTEVAMEAEHEKGNCSEAIPFYYLTRLQLRTPAVVLHASLPARGEKRACLTACDYCLN